MKKGVPSHLRTRPISPRYGHRRLPCVARLYKTIDPPLSIAAYYLLLVKHLYVMAMILATTSPVS